MKKEEYNFSFDEIFINKRLDLKPVVLYITVAGEGK